jgi:chemosensory pili system protein ChpB (putative protein-glutamate methylesterase)
MAEALSSVALLFDDAELGSHLRQALQEHGAHIVHEGTVAGFDATLLRQFDPDVLVVNLDEEDDESFDRLFGVIEGERPRLVLNDARASRALAGWDRARWARHLAVKVLANGDVDPPRPLDALAVETAPAVALPLAESVAAFSAEPVAPALAEPEPPALDMPASSGQLDQADEHTAQTLATSNDLEAELAALLAEPVPAEPSIDEPATLLEPDAVTEPAAHHDQVDGHGAHLLDADDLEAELAALLATADPFLPEAEPAPLAPREELPLHDGDFSFVPHSGDEPSAAQVEMPAPVVAFKAPAVPDSWALVDHDATVHADAKPEDAGVFGIQKVSAADFLAPDVEPAAAEFQPAMSLELVSLEEAVAPQAWEQSSNEMLLDDLGGALSRVLLLGAAVDGLDSVCEFLAILPATARHTILLTQHFGGKPDDAVLQRLSDHSSLPVRLAAHGGRARAGEVLLVPATGQVQLRRDGSIELREQDGTQEPSIDASFTMAANAFGRDALGIVFAGRSTDAVAGAQAIHDRGGQVWVESANSGHYADMVSGIFAERLVSYSGTLHELAAHLNEVYP